MQELHTEAPVLEEYEPAKHSGHPLLLVLDVNVPAWHLLQALDPGLLYNPALHGVHAEAPVAL